MLDGLELSRKRCAIEGRLIPPSNNFFSSLALTTDKAGLKGIAEADRSLLIELGER